MKSDFHFDLYYQLDGYGESDVKSTHSMISGRGRGKSSSSSLEAMTSKREILVRLVNAPVQSSSLSDVWRSDSYGRNQSEPPEVQARGVGIVSGHSGVTDRELAG